jgi:hypothetical protein
MVVVAVHRSDVADDCGYVLAHEVSRETGQPVELVVGMPLLDRDVTALDKSFIGQPLAQFSTRCANGAGGVLRRNPTIGTAGCCARAASGQAAAPPMSVMNSRRRMAPPPALGIMALTGRR